MSRVAAVTLAFFRSWRQATLPLGGRSAAIHGPNGAGKTNLLEAVSALAPGRGLRRAETADLARAPERRGWRVTARVEAEAGLSEIDVAADADGRKRVAIDGKAASQTALGALLPMLWLTPAMDRLWIEGAEERRRFLDRVTLALYPGHAAEAAAYDRAMRERNRLLRDGPRDPGWLDALEARMAASGVAVACARARAAARLTAAQENAKSLFPKAEIAILGDVESALSGGVDDAARAAAVERDFRAALARARREDEAAGRAVAGPHRTDLAAVYAAKGMEARACSTGEQKALLISLTLATARALAAARGAPPLLLLDEVAAHLDAGRRAALFDELSALGAQALMTGTGPELFDALGPEALRVRVAEGPEGSTLTVEDDGWSTGG